MKTIYRRPYKIDKLALQLITVLAMIILYIVQWQQPLNYQSEMKQSISLTQQGMAVIKKQKQTLAIMTQEFGDPTQSGMIGTWQTTPVTSVMGHLDSKQASVNANFSALIYRWLIESGVRPGDHVAISASGSFPALNLATYSALHTLGAKPLVILSLTASQWGANQPEFLWIDMATLLKNHGLINIEPLAVSYGAAEDNAHNISSEGISLLNKAITRNGNPDLIYTGSLMANIDQKWQIYQRNAGNSPIKAFINIGGAKSSVGSNQDKKQLFQPGLNNSLPAGSEAEIPGLMWRFIDSGLPVIHLSNIKKIVADHHLDKPDIQHLYQDPQAQRVAAIIGLLILFLALFGAAFWYNKRQQELNI